MIRELAKSALSFSWALSLLGMKQTANMFRPGQQRGSSGDLFRPITQSAVEQLDAPLKDFFRSGDNMQSQMVDMAFMWMNPFSWMNPGAMGRMRTGRESSPNNTEQSSSANGQCCGQQGNAGDLFSMWMVPFNMMNPARFMSTWTQTSTTPPTQNSQYASSNPPNSGGTTSGWGPMPEQQS